MGGCRWMVLAGRHHDVHFLPILAKASCSHPQAPAVQIGMSPTEGHDVTTISMHTASFITLAANKCSVYRCPAARLRPELDLPPTLREQQ